jgi:hypothetical protein
MEAHDVIATNWIGDLWLIEGGLHTGGQLSRVMPGTVVKLFPLLRTRAGANTHPYKPNNERRSGRRATSSLNKRSLTWS